MKVRSLHWQQLSAIVIIVLFVGTSLPPAIRGGKVIKEEQNRDSSTDWWPMFHHDLAHSGYSTSRAPGAVNLMWIFQEDMIILSSPTVVDRKVYTGSNHAYYCLNYLTGEKIWQCNTTGWADGNPTFDNGRLYTLSRDQYGENKIFCLNASTGKYLWNYTDCYWPFNPVVSNGKVYFGSLDGEVRCLNAQTGDFIWSFSTNSVGTSNAPTINNGKVYIGAENGRMYCLNASSGDELWNYSTGGKIMECPSIANGKVYFGSVDYKIYCLNAETGQSVWNYTTAFYVDSTPAIAYGKLFIGSRDCSLYCLNANTGGFLWSYMTDDEVDSSPAVADEKVYVGSDDGKLYCFDAVTGAKIWDYTTGSFIESSPAIVNGKIYIGSYDNKLYCFGGELTADFSWTPTAPSHGQTVTFNASASYDPNEYNITSYEWDWNQDGIYDEETTAPITTHLWPAPGVYPVTLRVTNSVDQTATVTKTVSVGNRAPDPPSITGPANGKAGTRYPYSFEAMDPDDDNISYLIDWGDHTNGSWIGPYPSGLAVNQSHAWTTKGSYLIKAQAKDLYGVESGWTTLLVSMPLSYAPPHFRFLSWLFERFPGALPILRHLLGY